jgi:hypothetical protein
MAFLEYLLLDAKSSHQPVAAIHDSTATKRSDTSIAAGSRRLKSPALLRFVLSQPASPANCSVKPHLNKGLDADPLV